MLELLKRTRKSQEFSQFVMKKKNSLIEFYRFFFAMNVVKHHGYFPYQGKYFSPGHISVEFFFILSGFLLRKSFDKFINLPYFKGLFLMLKNKLFAMGIPFVVAMLVHIPYKIITGSAPWWDFSDWGYLWYVFDMLAIDIFYFTIRKFVKSEKIFFVVAAAVFLTASVFHAIPQFRTTGWFRALGTMSLGILVSYIPELKLKRQWLLFIPLAFIWAYILRILLFDYTFVEAEILNLVAYPALIFLTFQLSVDNKVFNYLGALSFGLYAYQAVPRLMYVLGVGNVWIYFFIVVGLAVLTDLLKKVIKRVRDNRSNKEVELVNQRS